MALGDDEWLEKLDAATAGDVHPPSDVRLAELEERIVIPLAPADMRDRHREPSGWGKGSEPSGHEIGERFDRVEALLLDLALRVERVDASPPPVPIEALQSIEVGIRAAARVILRSSDELTAAVDSIAEAPASNPTVETLRRLVATVERLDQRLQTVEHRLDYIAESDAALKAQLEIVVGRLKT